MRPARSRSNRESIAMPSDTLPTPFDLSSMHVVRLNAEMFPPSEFELEAYARHGLRPRIVEATGEEILRVAADCDGLLVVSEALPAELIERLTRCRVLSRIGAGTDKIHEPTATRQGIVITNVPDFCAEEQADHTMALLLSVARKLTEMRERMLAGEWNAARAACRPLHRLRDRVLGLVGFGLSARGVAERARGFGLRILATRRNPSAGSGVAQALGVEMTDLDTLLRESDYVSLHLPLNEATRGMFSAEVLARMKPGSVLINTSRGALVDESALADAVKRGHLAGAGLDTFHDIQVHVPSSDPPQHPLLTSHDIVFTPHVAAFSVESSRDVGWGAVNNLAAVLTDHWPPAERIVNPSVIPRQPLR